MNWEPLFDKILVRRHEAPKEIGGIQVPDVGEKPQQRGYVLATGPGRLSLARGEILPLVVKPGDEVMFGQFSGTDLSEVGKDLILLREDELLMVRKAEEPAPAVPTGPYRNTPDEPFEPGKA